MGHEELDQSHDRHIISRDLSPEYLYFDSVHVFTSHNGLLTVKVDVLGLLEIEDMLYARRQYNCI